ncbi:hypothetical protein FOPG_16970 [Fusarium oxysporum f. sp. conglutinans race 2 54008]|uniref:Heterokaryon incompatibility domain-containing protein n=2 Tax=Fusarium oxysporum f. sp. conglutinans TaxID=100902 RepID=F9GEK7_FUSOF|nr:hypothetical protein FOXB_17091 [Fusarium oxysporum f. sp. conglutinans Fo5176]EXL66882.1 hypothetical protein FOPG_16970 [Fusarium oxysporum f. sp. conglutinans race 2 54008]KAG6979649.1 hypothetical protein FocnCong_v010351 [Fusarium oxysporum f. sp. conglutinans]KAI8402268.1 hypothetical protein FOFC_17575 [Fusarium oxysporum]
MSLRVAPTGNSSSSASRLCSWCEKFVGREPSDDVGLTAQSPKAIERAAKHGCYICGWLALTFNAEALQKLYLNVPSSKTRALLSISLTKIDKSFDTGIGPPSVILNVIHDTGNRFDSLPGLCELQLNLLGYAGASHPYDPPNSLQLESASFRNLATTWMEACRNHHQRCRESMVANNTFVPTRLIKIIDAHYVQLVFSSDLGKIVDYVALSHRWGDSQPFKLLKKNLAQLRTNIQVKGLPRTYKKAFTTCTALRFQYIWIDSLCIIQDSQEDWQKEAATMHLVYGNSTLNICMPGAATTRDARLIKPLDVIFRRESEPPRTARMVCTAACNRDLFFSPLRSRGWIFQESFLSKRSLVFGCIQLWWHCHEQLACETFPEGTDYGARFGPGVITKKELGAMKLGDSEANEHKDAHPMSSYERWWNMVRQYANTNLSHEGDRVIAFSGVAQAFRISHNISGQYLAGIWSCNLPKGLLWCREPNDAAGLRSKSYKAPSWSWMSIDGDYILHEGFQYATKSCCSIEQIYVHLIDETHDTGLLNGGALRIHGHLIGPIPVGSTIDTLDEDILRCHVRTEEEADDGVCMVNEDEEGPDGVPFISYLDGLDPELGRVGLMSGAFRQTIAFSDAEGSIFCLPIVYRYEDTEEPYESELSGLILYNPPHQRGIYHRIGYYEMECKAIPDFNAMLREQHPPQSILLL